MYSINKRKNNPTSKFVILLRKIAKRIRNKLRGIRKVAQDQKRLEAMRGHGRGPLQDYRRTFKGVVGRRLTHTERLARPIYGKDFHLGRRVFQKASRIAFMKGESFSYTAGEWVY